MSSHDTGRDVPVRRMNRRPWQRAATPLVLLALASCVVTGTLIGLLARTDGVGSRNAGSIEPSGGIPIANFTSNSTTVLAGDRVRFMFTGDRGDELCTFQWSFGDGSENATTENTTHAYLASGTFDVALTVADAGNESSTLAKVSYIAVLSASGDADGDGLTNQDELRVRHTDPLRFDTDGDNWGDGKEVLVGKNPLSAADFPRTGDLLWSRATGEIVISSPAVSDVDGDGKAEIVIGSNDKRLYCLSGATGAVKWSFLAGDFIRASPAIADVNGDGLMEIFFGSDDNKVHCLYGNNGIERWSFLTGNDVQSTLAIGDVNDDGNPEVIFGSYDCKVYCLNAINGSLEWKTSKFSSYVSGNPTLVDIDSNGILEVFVPCNDDSLYCLSGLNGSVLWNNSVGRFRHSQPTFADADYDGELEIFIGGCNNYPDEGVCGVYCLSSLNGSIRWKYATGNHVAGNPSLADVDRDGKLEILVGSTDNRMYCLKACNGSLEWAYRTGDEVNTCPVVGDVDSDYRFEVIFGSSDDKLYCLSGDNGSLEWYKLTGNFIWSNPAVGDLDGDGHLEIVFGSLDWKVYCLVCSGPFWALPGPWSTSGGSSSRTGIYIDNDNDGLIDAHEIGIGTDPATADTDGDGAPDGAEISVRSNPLDPLDRPAPRLPVAIFSWSPAVPVPGLPVQFTDASYDIGGTIALRSWDFGDNTTDSTDRHPVHIFSSAGAFMVTLVVTDNDGSSGTLARLIEVAGDARPTADFSTNATAINAGQSVAFMFNGSLGNVPASFQWSFGDGMPNSTAMNPVHRYVSAGDFTVSLEVTDVDGDVACCHRVACIHVDDAYPVANFTANSTIVLINTLTYFTYTGTDGNVPLSFQWTFGDGTTNITNRNPSHKYTAVGNYTVTVTVTDVDGDKSTMRRVNYIQAIADLVPVVTFVVNATSIAPGAWVAFTFTGSEGDAPATFSWNFGDGGTSSARNPAHRYVTAGNFTVVLTVIDNDDDARSSTMVVYVAPPYVSPVASFHSNATAGMGVGTAVVFTFDGSCGSGTPSFFWNFGDGAYSTSRDPVHVYWSLGMFDVNVTVVDGTGMQDTAVQPGHVVIVDLAPSASFAANVTAIVQGRWIAFTFTGTTGDGAATFAWDFGDGSPGAATRDTIHQYATAGNFTATLVVTDADGDSSTATCSIAVSDNHAPWLIDAIVSPTIGIETMTFNFSVRYFDPDNDMPAAIAVTINETTFTMVAASAADTNVVDGKTYCYTTTLPWGHYHFRVDCSDGTHAASTTWIAGPAVAPFLGLSPLLSNPNASIVSTNGSSTVEFSVTYTHPFGAAPEFIDVIIDDHSFSLKNTGAGDADYAGGCRYIAMVLLSPGQHEYQFRCGDGWNTVSTSSMVLDVAPGNGPETLGTGSVKLVSIVLSAVCAAGAVSTGAISRRSNVKKRRAKALETGPEFGLDHIRDASKASQDEL
nr:PKD domain-containing protein [Candidatus Sigynarchaeota archaeon]